MSKKAWNVNNIDDVAMISFTHTTLLMTRVDGVSSPHGAGGIGPLSGPLGSHLLPKQALQLCIPFIRENTSMENNKANLVFAASKDLLRYSLGKSLLASWLTFDKHFS